MSTGEALRLAMLQHPLDEMRRFVYADYLEERGEQRAADWLRNFGKGMTWVDMVLMSDACTRQVRFGTLSKHFITKALIEIRQRKSDALWEWCCLDFGKEFYGGFAEEERTKHIAMLNLLKLEEEEYAPQATRPQAIPSSAPRRKAQRQRQGV